MADSPVQPQNNAVFLSYAHEDAAAARRIADALRAFGIEVWFDSNELRGGDIWDAKIRSQIKACGLFLPIVSQTTQTRREAYFRLEWKLAEDRTHLLAPGTPFLVPVVIDDTPEYEASVPESFSKAHWTRLPGGEPTPEFGPSQLRHPHSLRPRNVRFRFGSGSRVLGSLASSRSRSLEIVTMSGENPTVLLLSRLRLHWIRLQSQRHPTGAASRCFRSRT